MRHGRACRCGSVCLENDRIRQEAMEYAGKKKMRGEMGDVRQ